VIFKFKYFGKYKTPKQKATGISNLEHANKLNKTKAYHALKLGAYFAYFICDRSV
jgi:hypothetical protein